MWYLDSGCSKHMTGNKRLFLRLEKQKGGFVTFGDNGKGKICGVGDIGNDQFILSNVLYVKGLKHNLLSISQMCDNGYDVVFKSGKNIVELINCTTNDKICVGNRVNNVYTLPLYELTNKGISCLVARNEEEDLWHRRTAHASLRLLKTLVRKDMVRGLPKLKFEASKVCDSCAKGKIVRTSFSGTKQVMSTKPLQLVHMDLFGPVSTESIGRKKYCYVLVDDFSRFTWVFFLANKTETFEKFKNFVNQIERSVDFQVIRIRSDHGTEFQNSDFDEFCKDKGIFHEYSSPRTPQQNGVVERKNRTLITMARTMLLEYAVPKSFWAEAINTACHVINRINIRPFTHKTAYEIWYNIKPNISHFHVFGCKCYMLNTKDHIAKFDSKSDECIFLGYSSTSKAYRVFNKRTNTVEESIHIIFDESNDEISCRENEEEEIQFNEHNENTITPEVQAENKNDDEKDDAQPKELKFKRDHGKELVIGDVNEGIKTRASIHASHDYVANLGFISKIEPKNVNEALDDENWINAMHEELNQFERNNVWHLVEKPKDQHVIGTKWVFKNKLDENGKIVRNKARLVAQGYSQIEGIDFIDSFAPVARLESIRMLLAYASFKRFDLFQMDVKSAFLNGFIEENVFVAQPPGFERKDFPNHVFQLNKALYGLKQAPRAWYSRLSAFLLENGFIKGKADKTLFTKHANDDILIVQVYVDDIIFGATNDLLCHEFEKVMQAEFEMSNMGKLTYFLGFQVKQCKDGIFITQEKYTRELLKKFNIENAKSYDTPMGEGSKIDSDIKGKSVDITTYRGMIGSLLYLTATRPDIMFAVCLCARYQSAPKESHLKVVKRIFRYLLGTPHFGLWYPRSSDFSLIGFSDSDYAGSICDRKSTSGTCHFLGTSLVSWSSRKQNCVALSTAESEYIALGSCCAQSLWMIQTLEDFGLKFEHVTLFCDSKSAIDLTNNHVHHSRTKHIDVRYHFIRSHVESKRVIIEHVTTDKQLADIFTKPLKKETFLRLRCELGVLANVCT